MKTFLSLLLFISCIITTQAQQLKPIDSKSEVEFTVKNFGLNTPGTFKGLKGTIQFNPSNLSSASFNVSVDVNTVNTGIDMRDSHLKGEDYFYAEKYSTVNFVSTSVKQDGKTYVLSGELTIKGISKPISFPFTFVQQNDGMLFTGNFSINRKDFNVGGGSAVLSNNVDISLKVFAQ